MTSEFMQASAEILDIFQYIPMELKNRIPNKLIKVFENSANKNYISIINPDKSITAFWVRDSLLSKSDLLICSVAPPLSLKYAL